MLWVHLVTWWMNQTYRHQAKLNTHCDSRLFLHLSARYLQIKIAAILKGNKCWGGAKRWERFVEFYKKYKFCIFRLLQNPRFFSIFTELTIDQPWMTVNRRFRPRYLLSQTTRVSDFEKYVSERAELGARLEKLSWAINQLAQLSEFPSLHTTFLENKEFLKA